MCVCLHVFLNVYIYIYAIMKTKCPPGYHHNGFVATHALGHMMYGLVYYGHGILRFGILRSSCFCEI